MELKFNRNLRKDNQFLSEYKYYSRSIYLSNGKYYRPVKNDNIVAKVKFVLRDCLILTDGQKSYLLQKTAFRGKRNLVFAVDQVFYAYVNFVWGNEIMLSCDREGYGLVENGYLFQIEPYEIKKIYFSRLKNPGLTNIEFFCGSNGIIFLKGDILNVKKFVEVNFF